LSIHFTEHLVQLKEFHVESVLPDAENKRFVAQLQPRQNTYCCPDCNRLAQGHGQKTRTLRHQWIPGRWDLYVAVPILRKKCVHCNQTWTVRWNGIPERGNVTEHFKKVMYHYCQGKSIQEVAKAFEEPYTTVERWYYDQARQSLPSADQVKQAPARLCIDDFAIKRGHQYAMAYMDHETGRVWELSEGRDRASIQTKLKNWPFAKPPEVVVTDLARGIEHTVCAVWKEVLLVADKFHVIQLFTKKLEHARKRLLQVKKHRHIRHKRRLLMTKPENLKPDERDKRDLLLAEHEDLRTLYDALQDFRKIYDSRNFKDAKTLWKEWLNKYMYSTTGAARSLTETLLAHETMIFNYFKARYTNGPMEGTNNKIKTLKRRAYGFRNQERFFTRIRLECAQAA